MKEQDHTYDIVLSYTYFVVPLYFTPRFPKVRPPRKIEERRIFLSATVTFQEQEIQLTIPTKEHLMVDKENEKLAYEHTWKR